MLHRLFGFHSEKTYRAAHRPTNLRLEPARYAIADCRRRSPPLPWAPRPGPRQQPSGNPKPTGSKGRGGPHRTTRAPPLPSAKGVWSGSCRCRRTREACPREAGLPGSSARRQSSPDARASSVGSRGRRLQSLLRNKLGSPGYRTRTGEGDSARLDPLRLRALWTFVLDVSPGALGLCVGGAPAPAPGRSPRQRRPGHRFRYRTRHRINPFARRRCPFNPSMASPRPWPEAALAFATGNMFLEIHAPVHHPSTPSARPMSAAAALPPAPAETGAERRDRQLGWLREMGELGMKMARNAATKALDPQPDDPGRAAPAPDPTLAFARVTRAVRQAIALENRVAAEAAPRHNAAGDFAPRAPAPSRPRLRARPAPRRSAPGVAPPRRRRARPRRPRPAPPPHRRAHRRRARRRSRRRSLSRRRPRRHLRRNRPPVRRQQAHRRIPGPNRRSPWLGTPTFAVMASPDLFGGSMRAIHAFLRRSRSARV